MWDGIPSGRMSTGTNRRMRGLAVRQGSSLPGPAILDGATSRRSTVMLALPERARVIRG